MEQEEFGAGKNTRFGNGGLGIHGHGSGAVAAAATLGKTG